MPLTSTDRPRRVAVFVPYAVCDGRPVSPEYDTPAYRAEVASWLTALGRSWEWVPVTVDGLHADLDRLAPAADPPWVVLNLCDGDEVHGYPGPSVVRALERAGVPFTGAGSAFYEATTYKGAMKARLLDAGVATPPFVRLTDTHASLEQLARRVGFPAFVKPEVSAASVGIGLRSRVRDAAEAAAQLERLTTGPWGPGFAASGILAERYVDGPEFTVLLAADRRASGGVHAYPAVERVFHSALPPEERFLSYDRYWSVYQEETRLPEGEPFYRYALAAPAWQEPLLDLARRAYFALDGTGYARVDLRADRATGACFVLEVNANCGLSGDSETSVGQILRLTGSSMPELLARILGDAVDRAGPR